MVIAAALGGACFLLVCIVGGSRLCRLSLRTRKFPELALGAGMLLMGGIATPLLALVKAPLGLPDETKVAILTTHLFMMALGMAGFARFTQSVFRPNVAWAKLLWVALPLGMLAGDLHTAAQERGLLLVLDGRPVGYAYDLSTVEPGLGGALAVLERIDGRRLFKCQPDVVEAVQ